ncbi:MAG: aminotransferase class V-fold PLP-dependent enzyme, partial [Thermoanaerobaculia bacterium]
LYGPPPDAPRTPTVSFVVDGRPSADVAEALARRALFLSSGDFYAWTVVQRLGHASDGLVRAGCACYTTEEEIDRLLDGVRDIAGSR